MPSTLSQASARATTGLETLPHLGQIPNCLCSFLPADFIQTTPFCLCPRFCSTRVLGANMAWSWLRAQFFLVLYVCHGSLDASRGQPLSQGPELHPSFPCFVPAPSLLSGCPRPPFSMARLACSRIILCPKPHHAAMLHLASGPVLHMTLQVWGQMLRLGTGMGLGLWSFGGKP